MCHCPGGKSCETAVKVPANPRRKHHNSFRKREGDSAGHFTKIDYIITNIILLIIHARACYNKNIKIMKQSICYC